jgi:hypothetical protein
MIGKIQHVLNINRHTNRAICFLVHALYIEIHFIIISNIANTIQSIMNRGASPSVCIEVNEIVVIDNYLII